MVASASPEKTVDTLHELLDAVELESNAERLAGEGAGIEVAAQETVDRILDAVETVELSADECELDEQTPCDPARRVADSLDGRARPQQTRDQKGLSGLSAHRTPSDCRTITSTSSVSPGRRSRQIGPGRSSSNGFSTHSRISTQSTGVIVPVISSRCLSGQPRRSILLRRRRELTAMNTFLRQC